MGSLGHLYDPNLYLKDQGVDIVIINVYLDDLVITCILEEMVETTKNDLKKAFDISV